MADSTEALVEWLKGEAVESRAMELNETAKLQWDIACKLEELSASEQKHKVALTALRAEIEPLAAQVICPANNTFARQLALIEEALS